MISKHDRDTLLAYLYGALDDDERAALDARLAQDDELRAALDDARAEQQLLGDAATLSGDEVGGSEFQLDTRAARGRIFSMRGVAAAATVLVAIGVGILGYVQVNQSRYADRYPVVAVAGPSSFVPESPVEYAVQVTDLDGDAHGGRVEAKLVDGNGDVQSTLTQSVGDDGRAVIAFDPSASRPGEEYRVLFTTAFGDAAKSVKLGAALRDTTRVITRVSTDKPVYRPGETIRMRGVALESLRLAPAGDVPMRLRLLDPRGGVVVDQTLPSKTGVTAWEHTLDAAAAGGAYRLELTGAAGEENLVSPAVIDVPVRAYRTPRLTCDVALDRSSYGPGDEGSAWIAVERIEGGVPEGATVTSTLFVDGIATQVYDRTVSANGALAVPFRIPAEIDEGRVRLSLTVDDSGSVEGFSETVPVALRRVDVELFPEGGDLVAGLRNRVYFRATTPAGEPADIAFDVLDGDSVVASARTDVLGMGVFEMQPEHGKAYEVSASAPVGIDVTHTFPPVAERGAVLRALDDVTAAGEPLRLELSTREPGAFIVSATVRGTQVATQRVVVAANSSEEFALDAGKQNVLGGVVRVTATRADGSPAAERLVYRETARRLNVVPATDRPRYGPRENVDVTVNVTDEAGRPAVAILGATVVDEGIVAMAGGDNIPLPLHFLLGMEVEELEEAELYAAGPQAAVAVDRLLGVQGWRRFAWRTPAEFLEANPETGPRVLGVESADLPVSVSNESRARNALRRDMRRVEENATGTAVLAGVALLFFGGIFVGVRSLWLHRPFAAAGGFAVPALLLGLVVLAFTGLGGRMAPGADMAEAVARMAPGAVAEAQWDAGAMPEAEMPMPVAVDAMDLGEVLADPRLDRLREMVQGEILHDEDGDEFIDADFELEFEDADAKWDAEHEKKRMKRIILTREFAHRATEWRGVREDFAEVLYWKPIVVTDDKGEATFSFDTPDSVTRFRVAIDAHDARGALGAGHMTFENRVLFYAEPKLPLELSAGDELLLPISVVNDGPVPANVFVDVTSDSELLRNTVSEGAQPGAQIDAGARDRVTVPLRVAHGQGEANLTVRARTQDGREDVSRRAVRIVPRGYPMSVSKSGTVTDRATAEIHLPEEYDRTSLRGGMRVYPSTLATLVDGLDGMLSEPYGCFEQASSTNYPNVLVLDYLRRSDVVEPAVAARAQELLDKGYQLLTGYECDGDGYEWFGADPGHEALTAYGVLEFADMARVYDVDLEMLDRTRNYLLERRDGKGGFEIQERQLDTFGGAPKEVTEAYIVWALTEADPSTDVAMELAQVVANARQSDDAYMVALAVLAMHNRGHEDTDAMLARLAALQQPDGTLGGARTSITSSSGVNLDVETAALAVLAFDREPKYLANAESAIRFILKQRQDGRFGATQATILALRALTVHAEAAGQSATDVDVEILHDGEVVATRHVPANTPGVLDFSDELLPRLHSGKNTFEIRAKGGEALPWAITLGYHTRVPATDPACPVTVATTLGKDTVGEGESVGLTAVISNTTDKPLAMTIARVGFPAGLEARIARLDELKEAGEIDFYEVRPREVTLYWRGMRASEEKTVAMDFTAAVPGRFEGPASSAYLYYADDAKHWTAPLGLAVDAR